jgi:ketosteroid isomerase-like protein
MSQENVEIVRALAEGFQRRQHERAFEFYDREIEWDASRIAELLPDNAGVFRGHEGVRAYWRDWLSAWSDVQFEIEDVRDAGDDVVLLIRNQRQWGKHSGLETELPPYAMVFTLRDRKVIRWRSYPDQRSALEAAGLSEGAISPESVEVVRRMLEAFNRDDPDSVVAAFAEDCRLDEPREMPDRHPAGYRGHEGIREWMDKLRGVAEVRFEPEGFEVCGDVIVSEWAARGRGQASGVPIDWPTFAVLHMREGKIARAEGFLTLAEAREAAGLAD